MLGACFAVVCVCVYVGGLGSFSPVFFGIRATKRPLILDSFIFLENMSFLGCGACRGKVDGRVTDNISCSAPVAYAGTPLTGSVEG